MSQPKFDEITNVILRDFCKEKCDKFSDFCELIFKIGEMEIKINNKKILKLTVQIMRFVYSKLMEFLLPDSSIQSFLNNFFENVYHFTNFKIHLHHSHVTGKILSYSHDFCNWRVRENQIGFSCLVHNFFLFWLLLFTKRH